MYVICERALFKNPFKLDRVSFATPERALFKIERYLQGSYFRSEMALQTFP